MTKPKSDPLSWNNKIVFPETGLPTPEFLRQFNVSREFDGQVADLFAITFVAGVGLSGGGVLGDLNDITFDLEDTAVTPGTYGDGTNVPQITIDQQGRITAAVDVPFSASTSRFAGATHTGAVSTVNAAGSATVGIYFTPDFDMYVTHVWMIVDPVGAGEDHYAQIAEVTDTTSASDVVGAPAQTGTYTSTGTQGHLMRLAFATDVLLEAGTPYVIVGVNASGIGTTVLRIMVAPEGAGNITWRLNAAGVQGADSPRYSTVGLSAAQSPTAQTTDAQVAIALEGYYA